MSCSQWLAKVQQILALSSTAQVIINTAEFVSVRIYLGKIREISCNAVLLT